MFITPDKMDGKRISYDYVVQQYEIQRLLQGHPLIALRDLNISLLEMDRGLV